MDDGIKLNMDDGIKFQALFKNIWEIGNSLIYISDIDNELSGKISTYRNKMSSRESPEMRGSSSQLTLCSRYITDIISHHLSESIT